MSSTDSPDLSLEFRDTTDSEGMLATIVVALLLNELANTELLLQGYQWAKRVSVELTKAALLGETWTAVKDLIGLV